jgi:hypothetical protein
LEDHSGLVEVATHRQRLQEDPHCMVDLTLEEHPHCHVVAHHEEGLQKMQGQPCALLVRRVLV